MSITSSLSIIGTYTVTTTADSGEGSLRYGVETLQAPAISFDPALAGATIALKSALLVTSSITISGDEQTVIGSGLSLSDSYLWLENIAFTVDALTITGGNNLAIGDDASITARELVVETGYSMLTGDFRFAKSGVSRLVVAEGASLYVEADQLGAILSADVINAAGALMVDGDVDWQEVRTIKENNTVNYLGINGAIRNFDQFTLGKGSSLTLGATELTGTDKNNSFTLKENAKAQLYTAIDFGARKNSVAIGANATWASFGVANVSNLKLAAGKSYKDVDGQKVQGWTNATIAGDFTGTDGKNALNLGKFSTLDITGNLGNGSAGSTVKLGSEAKLILSNDVFGLNSLNLANGKVYVDDDGARSWEYTHFTAQNVAGTAGNDSIKLGNYAGFIANSLDLGAGKNSVSVGAGSYFHVYGDAKGLDSLKLASGKKVKGEPSDSANAYVGGTLSVNKIQLGTDAWFNAGTIQSNDGDLTVKMGANSYLYASELTGLHTLSVASGKADTLSTVSVNNLTGTAGNDSIKLGNYCEFRVDNSFDLSDGKNTVALGKNSTFRVDGNLANITELKIGKESTLILSTEAVAALDTITKADYDWGYTIADVGKIGVAQAFTALYQELADNTLASESAVWDGFSGWLSNKEDYGDDGDITCWNDLADFFQASGADNDLTGWQVTGDAGSLQVKVWKNDGTAWDSGTEITEAGGVWDLSQVSITGAADYRISVEIADSAAKDAYSYRLIA